MAAIVNQTSITSPYSPNDTELINTSQIESFFNPSTDYIEFIINSPNSSYQNVNYDYKDFIYPIDGTVTSDSTSQLEINPSTDINKLGITGGEYNLYYNFLKNELLTSYNNQDLFIKSISADRTELIVKFKSNVDSSLIVSNFVSKNTSFYFNDFYLNFGDNVLVVANNIEANSSNNEILINLYNPLPNNISVSTPFWVVTKVADTLSFNITFSTVAVTPTVTSFPLKGPNFNLSSKDQLNNSTVYFDYNTLITSSLLSTSYSQLNNLISSSGIEINVDYTDFSNFIFFSSAVQRIKNFATKVTQISSSQAEINILNASSGYITSSNITILTKNINNIIENFDGYEYYLYYDSGSYSWPKSNTTIPYTLYSPTSTQVITWLGNEDPYNANYGGILKSASIYDNGNVNYLYKTVPEYLRDDPQNTPYKLFIDLVGQHYDDIWIYYQDITNLYQADNRLDHGVSKDLVAQALRSFGVNLYQNNFSTNDLYSAFLGYGVINPQTTSSLPVTAYSGQEYINNYVTESYASSVEPLDDINKEVYKRIYHNLPYLAKTKGTIPGLRALINCFGVPDTILRISEFGGRDKDTSTYDYFDQQFNYAFDSFYDNAIGPNWLENQFELHPSWSANNNRPESIQLRFKTAGLTSTYQSQSIFTISSGSGGGLRQAGLTLLYTGSGYNSASYNGSIYSSSYQFAKLDFYPNTSFPNATASVYLPFFDEGWWSVMVNRSGSTYTLYAGNSLYYDGYDGNQIGYLASSSITTSSLVWPSGGYFTLNADAPVSIGSYNYTLFTGSYQELRFWARTGSVNSFKDFIMNPQSIDYTDELNYANYLAHRLPLGADLITTTSSLIPGSPGLTSVHPKVTGSWPTTQSFSSSAWGPNNTIINVVNNPWYVTNVEPRFLNSPVIGLRGRITDKIQIVSGSYPTGSVLSQYTSMEQSYPSLGSESPDVNLLEVAFSPQNEINDDIIDSLGYFNIGEYIGDPRQVSSSATSYPDLNTLSNNFFQKYFDTYDLFDYIRLIKYFDNSLFKMIKDFVPARTSLTSGVVIKQHLLERNKYPQPQVEWEELDYSGSIQSAFFSGSTGGTFNSYNTLTSFSQTSSFTVSGSFTVDPEYYINYFNISSSTVTTANSNVVWENGELTLITPTPIILLASGSNSPGGNTIYFQFSSSIRGNIEISSQQGSTTYSISSSIIYPLDNERFSLWVKDEVGSGPNIIGTQFSIRTTLNDYSNQTWPQYYTGSTGVSTIIHSTQDEFYNGELPGTEYVVTTGELNDANDFKYPTTLEIYYDPTLYLSNITSLEDFININTSPNQGEIYLWYDTGSILQPSGNSYRQR